jgi:hypothetical protein
MADPHVVTALRKKRAEVSGFIAELERKIARERTQLAYLDSTLRMFSPDTDPTLIPPKRPFRRTMYFGRNEISRRTLEFLRSAAGKPITTAAVTKAFMAEKALPIDDANLTTIVTLRVVKALRRLCKQGRVAKSGATRNAHWSLVPSLL